MAGAYYNEITPYAVDWLRALIRANAIAPGDVDDRSIEEVCPEDLRGYTQHHFFAGIGGWSYALRLAGWPDTDPVWTGSCPCQPFSATGKRTGFADERHLWPVWHWLIAQSRPRVIFGEQVDNRAGRAWLDLVCTDLEGLDYACGPCALPAAGVGSHQNRPRLWFVAEALDSDANRGTTCAHEPSLPVVDPVCERGCGGKPLGADANDVFAPSPWADPCFTRSVGSGLLPVPSGFRALAAGVPTGVGHRLRGYGNAIVPQVAAAMIAAYRAHRVDAMAAAWGGSDV